MNQVELPLEGSRWRGLRSRLRCTPELCGHFRLPSVGNPLTIRAWHGSTGLLEHQPPSRIMAMDLDIIRWSRPWCMAAGQGDTATMPDTLANAIEHLAAVDVAPTPAVLVELIGDKGYHANCMWIRSLTIDQRSPRPHQRRSQSTRHCSRTGRGNRAEAMASWWR